MAIEPEEARQKIAELVEKYKRDHARANLSEADVRAVYIDQLFLYLGWDVLREDPTHATRYHREGYVRDAGFVDVGLEIAGRPSLLLEAKRFGVLPRSKERLGDRTTEEKQAFRYARTRKLPYVILTNFERLQVFNADHERLILWFDDPEEYLRRLPELLHLSPDRVQAGSLPATERQLEIKPIDDEFLALLQDWRLRLANAIYEHNSDNPALKTDENFDFGKLMAAVQRILDRLILIRYADDKEVLLVYDVIETILSSYRRKGAYTRPDHLVQELVDFSHTMDDHHNTTLFQPGHICEQVFIPNDVLERIMSEINNISFRKFTSDILGNTYETYLGTKLVLKNGAIKSEERRDIRKAGGIYYTPTSVVHYIVDNTLGHLLAELEKEYRLHAIEKAQEIKVLDPACGSGSFLIYAYHVLADFYRRINKAIENEQVKLLASGSGADMFERLELFKHLPKPLDNYPHHILENQLYGVDIDSEAAEIAAVNLTMQAFADTRREKLPLILNENIKVGNSLISGTEEELRPYFGDTWHEEKPFNWEEEFKGIMQKSGFDVVVGNPPYGDLLSEEEKRLLFAGGFASGGKTNDVFRFFVERGLQLLKENGLLGMILPNSYLAGAKYEGFRECVLKNAAIVSVVDFGIARVFEQGVFNSILILSKTTDKRARQNNEVIFLMPGADETQDIASYQRRITKQRILAQKDWILTSQVASEIMSSSKCRRLEQYCDSKDAGINYQRIGVGWMSRAKSRLSKDILYDGARQHESDIPYLKGTDIGRYQLRDDHLYKRWLRHNYADFIRENETIAFNKSFFEAPTKIITRQTGDSIIGTLDTERWYTGRSLHCTVPKSDCQLSLKYILGLLNSELITYIYQQMTMEKGRAQAQVKLNKVRKLPIRRIDFANAAEKKLHDDLVTLVDRMLGLKKRLAPIRNTPCDERDELQRKIERTDRQIDNMVYDLYGLTEEERRIIEGER